MDKKIKVIVAGTVLVVLAILVVSFNFFSGGRAVDNTAADAAKAAANEIEQAAQANPAPEPPAPTSAPRASVPRK